ncbi:hypothetical protein [Georgenia wangjunii]|uniref:hypothetical protein n=1 Tax=Georgenia wangjunii TaxID=3117730 RepID=UPI002F261B59
MSGSLYVDEGALSGVADSLTTRQGTLNDPGVSVPSPDAGRSTDELASAITGFSAAVGEVATAVGALAQNVRSALEDYAAWDLSAAATAGSAGGSGGAPQHTPEAV